MTENSLADQKATLRQQLMQFRASIPPEIHRVNSEAIFNSLINLDEVQNAKSVFIYISYKNEVDTIKLLKYFLDIGKSIAVPKILPSKIMIATPFSGWDNLKPGELGILTPTGDECCADDIDVVITPGLGFTINGYRIGYGRGYYDKWFAINKVKYKVAVTFEVQLVDELPHEESDIPVDIIVTEKRIVKIPR